MNQAIELVAQEVLRRSNCLSVPVDVHQVCASLGVKVHEEMLEDQMSGVLIIKGGEKHILVNKTHHPNRKRFTIAHELGHLTLHDGEKDQVFIDSQIRVYQRVGEPTHGAYTQPGSMTNRKQEQEANAFAAALLMPAPSLQHAALEHDLWDEADISALARTFGVSEQAMSIRLQQLNVVEIPRDLELADLPEQA